MVIPKRWPDSWYDNTNTLKCPARGCYYRFHNTYSMGARAKHWASPVPANILNFLETETDHDILLLLNQQTKCPQCDFFTQPSSSPKLCSRSRVDVRNLFEHEQQRHGTNDTTTINGFVRLVRKRRLRNLSMQAAAKPLVFRRLLQEIQKTQHYPLALEVAYIPFFPGGNVYREDVANFRAFNRPLGEPEHWAIGSEDFLMHLEPDPNEEMHVGYNWKQVWDDLRAAYEEGRI